jgi:hypothetical protein
LPTSGSLFTKDCGVRRVVINQIINTTDTTTIASQDDEGAVKVLQYAKQIRENF